MPGPVQTLRRPAAEEIEKEPESFRHRSGPRPGTAPGVAKDQEKIVAELLAEIARV